MEETYSEIKFIRLNTGEDLISEVVEVQMEDDTHYFTLINPLKLVYVTGVKPGILTISMMQWIFPKICKNQEFNIYANDILTMGEAEENMVQYYYKTLDHFNGMETDTISYTDDNYKLEDDFDEGSSTEDIMEMLKGLLNTNGTKKLH